MFKHPGCPLGILQAPQHLQGTVPGDDGDIHGTLDFLDILIKLAEHICLVLDRDLKNGFLYTHAEPNSFPAGCLL